MSHLLGCNTRNGKCQEEKFGNVKCAEAST